MRVIAFTVPGHPSGYYSQGRGRENLRAKRYHAWCRRVRDFAIMAGVQLPLTSSREHQLIVTTRAYYYDGNHHDPENTQKGVCDALFYGGKGRPRGSDKHVGGSYSPPLYDKENPRVEVEIMEA